MKNCFLRLFYDEIAMCSAHSNIFVKPYICECLLVLIIVHPALKLQSIERSGYHSNAYFVSIFRYMYSNGLHVFPESTHIVLFRCIQYKFGYR